MEILTQIQSCLSFLSLPLLAGTLVDRQFLCLAKLADLLVFFSLLGFIFISSLTNMSQYISSCSWVEWTPIILQKSGLNRYYSFCSWRTLGSNKVNSKLSCIAWIPTPHQGGVIDWATFPDHLIFIRFFSSLRMLYYSRESTAGRKADLYKWKKLNQQMNLLNKSMRGEDWQCSVERSQLAFCSTDMQDRCKTAI